MDQDTSEVSEPANLRFLRRLVTTLTAVMILGLLTIVALIVIRMFAPQGPQLPNTITLPSGATAQAFTRGSDWYAIVTTDDQILIYDATTNTLRQTIAIKAD